MMTDINLPRWIADVHADAGRPGNADDAPMEERGRVLGMSVRRGDMILQ